MSELLHIIKIGGNIIDNPVACGQFLGQFSLLAGHKILVHGGGKIATEIASRLLIETKMVEGRRITDRAMLDVVTMVYGGLVNKNLVAQLQALNCNGIGLTGADGGIIRAEKRPVKSIDYGFVGDIQQVKHGQIASMLKSDLVPVIAPLTYSLQGEMLNTNADTMASAIAVALSGAYTVQLIYCFEKKGVLSDAEDETSVLPYLDPALYMDFKNSGVISKGMLPKLDNAFAALQAGVSRVTICHAEDLTDAVAGNTGTHIRIK